MKKVLVLGAGKMVEAILVGLSSKVKLTDWKIYSPSGVSARELAKKVKACYVEKVEELNMDEFDFILIGCKPQQLKNLSLQFKDQFKNKLIISMLAALSEKEQKRILNVNKIIRIMPNLPVRYQAGVMLVSSESAPEEISSYVSLFSPLGFTQVVKENELDELTLLTGSGPALFYEFTKSLAQSFESLSFEARENLARSVLFGAGLSAMEQNESLSELISAVTSKGGVTIEVLKEWREENFDRLILKGILKGKKRTEEINQNLKTE